MDESRATEYAALYASGMTLEEIATGENCTRERVRQVLAEYPELYERAKVANQRAKVAKRTEGANRRRERAARLMARMTAGASLLTIAEAEGMTRVRLSHILHEFYPGSVAELSRLHRHPRGTRKYSDDDLRKWVEMFLAEGKPPYSSKAWQDFLVARGGPATRTFTMRYGRWAEMARHFGFEPVGADRGGPRTRRACEAAVLRVATELQRVPPANVYQRHKRQGEPSEGTVRVTLGRGSWVTVVRWLTPYVDPSDPGGVTVSCNSPEEDPN